MAAGMERKGAIQTVPVYVYKFFPGPGFIDISLERARKSILDITLYKTIRDTVHRSNHEENVEVRSMRKQISPFLSGPEVDT